jgi:Thioredoxin-like/PUB domain
MLAEMYHTLKEAHPTHGLEIVFISSDRDISSFQNYFASMPWVALPMSSPSFAGSKQRISNMYGVRGIPALVVLDAMSGQVVVSPADSRTEVVNACNRGDDAIEAMFSSWMDQLPTETKELASMLALSVIEDNVTSPPPTPSHSQDQASEYVRRSNVVEPKKDTAADVQRTFKLLVDDHNLSPNVAAARAIRIVAGQSSHMLFELQSVKVACPTRRTAESFRSHFQGMKRSAETSTALSTALKYLENVQKEPWNPKFRQFKLSNKIADRLFPAFEATTRSSTMEVVGSGSEYTVSIPMFVHLDEVVKELRLIFDENAACVDSE